MEVGEKGEGRERGGEKGEGREREEGRKVRGEREREREEGREKRGKSIGKNHKSTSRSVRVWSL